VYLPLEELDRFGVSRADLEKRVLTEDIVAALKFQIQRVRDLEEASKPGIKLLAPWSQPCIDAARVLYCGIVNEVERNNYEIFTKRASVPIYRRLAVAGPAWAKAVAARPRS
jgi:phytoene synthase